MNRIPKTDEIDIRTIIDLMPGNVYWMSRDGKFLGCNRNMLKILGFKSREEHYGKTYEDVFEPEEIKKIKAVDNEVMETDTPLFLEETAIKDGEVTATYLTHKVPLHDEAGNVIGLAGMSFDITERKQVEEELQEAKVAAKLQNEKIQAMKSIAASIAHELRTPLRSISNNANAQKYLAPLVDAYTLAKEAKLPIEAIRSSKLAAIAHSTEAIKRETKYANSFINMLLTNLKELDLETQTEAQSINSISECIDEALNRFPFSPASQAKLVKWDGKEDFLFKGEPLLIIHILFNLLKNALYYIEKAGKGTITISLETDIEYNKLIFRDTGTGIAADVLPHIFDHFYTTAHNGTGIGLSFCKLTMQNIGGDITCTSSEGEFTEFTLNFPSCISNS